MVQPYNHIFNVSRLYLSVPAFFYSLLLNVCDFNTEEIFLLKPNRLGVGGGEAVYSFLTVNALMAGSLKVF